MPDSLHNNSLKERDKKLVWHPFTPYKTIDEIIALVKSEGVYLIDENGNKYIDAVASWWVNLHGHSHPYLAKAIYNQALLLEHTIFAGFTHEPAVHLAERLIELTNMGFEKVFFSDNGSTSVEVALKMAIQYHYNKGTHKTKILALENAYHGDTFGAMSVAERNVFSTPFQNFLFDTSFIKAHSETENGTDISSIEAMLKTGEYAAFIFEPLVQGASGMIMYNAEWLETIISLCKRYNVITIADEVFTGFYRTGKAFACHYLNQSPDLMCLSKGLTGGMMALGATLVKSNIVDAFKKTEKHFTFFHGHSFTANPIACAAANASLDLTQEPDFISNVKRIENKLNESAIELKRHRKTKRVNSKGLILAIEIDNGNETNYLNPLSENATRYFLNKGYYIRPLGNVIYITPPVCISDVQLEDMMRCMTEYLDQLIDL